MDIKKMMRWALALAVALPLSMAFTACGDNDDDDDDPSSGDAASIIAKIDNKAFKWKDIWYADGSENVGEDRNYVTFNATSDNGGTVGYRCDYKEVYVDGEMNAGSITDRGTFTIKGDKIMVDVQSLKDRDVNWFKVNGNNLVANNGATFEYYGAASEVQTTDRPEDEYVQEYNMTISQIQVLLSDYKTQVSAGDPAASETRQQILSLQQYARQVRQEAAAQGIYIEQSKYETISI